MFTIIPHIGLIYSAYQIQLNKEKTEKRIIPYPTVTKHCFNQHSSTETIKTSTPAQCATCLSLCRQNGQQNQSQPCAFHSWLSKANLVVSILPTPTACIKTNKKNKPNSLVVRDRCMTSSRKVAGSNPGHP